MSNRPFEDAERTITVSMAEQRLYRTITDPNSQVRKIRSLRQQLLTALGILEPASRATRKRGGKKQQRKPTPTATPLLNLETTFHLNTKNSLSSLPNQVLQTS